VKINNNVSGRGYVHVYTGNGKGKTTAALGLAFRAMGRGMRTYIAQFMKCIEYGELAAAAQVTPWIIIEQFGGDIRNCANPQYSDDDVMLACNGLNRAEQKMLSGEYHIVILDEINVAGYYNLITIPDMLSFISKKPSGVELVLTGRYAAEEIIKAADLVSDIQEVKHYFQQGILARNGIER
jgi:cob(I)alamin adenosyltransferase